MLILLVVSIREIIATIVVRMAVSVFVINVSKNLLCFRTGNNLETLFVRLNA